MLDRPGLTVGWRFLYAHLLLADYLLQFAIEGIRARWPDFAPEEGLARIGRDRKIRRGLVEAADNYRVRLKAWRTTWRAAGTAYEICWAIRNYLGGSPGTIRVVNASGTWWTLDPAGTFTRTVTLPTKNWDWDAQDDLVARFWVILYADDYGWTRDGTWGDGSVWGDDGNGWGSTVPWRTTSDIRGIISDLKPGESVCKNVLISFDPTYPDPADPAGAPEPDGTWGSFYKIVGGTAVPSRDSRLLYWGSVA